MRSDYTLQQLKDGKFSLNQVERMAQNGQLSDDVLTVYLTAWNTTPGRFVEATWRDGAIRTRTLED